MLNPSTIDFRAARRQIEARTDIAAEVRQRAFAVWVGLFDVADAAGQVELPARELADSLGVSRVTWTEYRTVLVATGLLRVAVDRRGPYPQILQLLPPSVQPPSSRV